MTHQPILRFIEGIDHAPREMTDEEVTQLTKKTSETGGGDWFAQWLAKTPIQDRQLTLRTLLKETLPAGSYYMAFAVADGTPIVYDHENEDNPLNSVSRNLRFVIIALPDSDSSTQDLSEAILKRTLCIVGSSNFDGKEAFLQCASWDPSAFGPRKGLFRFFQRQENGSGEWVYFGDSLNAFDAASINHGPFDGHIGGALIMKELTSPWTHWYNVSNVNEFRDSLGSTRDKPSRCDPYNALYDPLFTPPSGAPLSLLGRAEALEPVVRTATYKWYASRFSNNFIDPETKQPRAVVTSPIGKWVGHILLNRSINIAACATSTAQVKAQAPNIDTFPMSLFVNINALQSVLPKVGNAQWDYNFETKAYTTSVNELQSSLYYDDYSSDPPTRRLAVEGSEGPFPFPIIEPGIEDYQGVATLVTTSTPKILPSKAIAAMLMIDFCNPIYSLARYELMQYIPDKAMYDEQTQIYDVLPNFVANVKASSASKVTGSPEHQILELLEVGDQDWETVFTERVNKYLDAVKTRLSDKTDVTRATAAVQEYMVLAEGRRRLYKGWEHAKPDGSGLDEFRMTLPIAARPDPFPFSEMTETGDVVTVSSEKLKKIIWYRSGGQPNTRSFVADGHSIRSSIASTGGCPAYAAAARARLGRKLA
ncbi:hypothetical protein AAF712_006798 [Marasmius tenuissimus]|uniref:Uncharacterized protein n=1 Tax=Marasmius tenuissimus TaxID=585030 RepID=A0ABR2ZXS3_9AGAR